MQLRIVGGESRLTLRRSRQAAAIVAHGFAASRFLESP